MGPALADLLLTNLAGLGSHAKFVANRSGEDALVRRERAQRAMLLGCALVAAGCGSGKGSGAGGSGPVAAGAGGLPAIGQSDAAAAGGADGADAAGTGWIAGTGGAPAPCAGPAALACVGTMIGPWCVDQLLVGDPGSPAFTGLWASGPSDVWAVGSRADSPGNQDSDGFAFHWDGCTWTQASIAAPGGLREVWGAAPSDVWAIGARGTALHFDGRTWTPAATGTASDLWSVSGTAGNDVWAIGGAGVLHWDGAAWSPSAGFPPPAGSQSAGDIWAVTARDVWAVGAGNAVVHFDGSTWTSVRASADLSHSLLGIWSDGTTAWAVGEGNQILELAAGTWSAVQAADGSSSGFRNVMAAGTEVWAVGLSVVHASSGGPFPIDHHLPAPDFTFDGLWITPAQVWASGTGPPGDGASTRAAVVVHRGR